MIIILFQRDGDEMRKGRVEQGARPAGSGGEGSHVTPPAVGAEGRVIIALHT